MTRVVCTLLFFLSLAVASSQAAYNDSAVFPRFSGNPLTHFGSIQYPTDGIPSINFPSVIVTPCWLPNRMGRYYKYFSDHHGIYGHLAYADDIHGPWVTYAPPTITLEEVYEANNETWPGVEGLSSSSEIASFDAWVDNENKRIVMYFHQRLPSTDFSNDGVVAVSSDGINFDIQPVVIGYPYLRHFIWSGSPYHYLVDRKGNISRSLDPLGPFEVVSMAPGIAFTNLSMVNGDGYTGLPRHYGVIVTGDILYVFGTRIGDAPERVLVSQMDLNCLNAADPMTACAMPLAVDAFRPQYHYEGVNEPIQPSLKGNKDPNPSHQLRDPFPFFDPYTGECVIFYNGASESNICAVTAPDFYCYPPDSSAAKKPLVWS